MLTPKNVFNKEEMRLLKSFRLLENQDKQSVISFAAFLAAEKNPTSQQEIIANEVISDTPKDIPRPKKETVIGAIKRLSEKYPMLDKGSMLDDTSVLMSAHLLQGRTAQEVIDDLELLFQKYYKTYQDRKTEIL